MWTDTVRSSLFFDTAHFHALWRRDSGPATRPRTHAGPFGFQPCRDRTRGIILRGSFIWNDRMREEHDLYNARRAEQQGPLCMELANARLNAGLIFPISLKLTLPPLLTFTSCEYAIPPVCNVIDRPLLPVTRYCLNR